MPQFVTVPGGLGLNGELGTREEFDYPVARVAAAEAAPAQPATYVLPQPPLSAAAQRIVEQQGGSAAPVAMTTRAGMPGWSSGMNTTVTVPAEPTLAASMRPVSSNVSVTTAPAITNYMQGTGVNRGVIQDPYGRFITNEYEGSTGQRAQRGYWLLDDGRYVPGADGRMYRVENRAMGAPQQFVTAGPFRPTMVTGAYLDVERPVVNSVLPYLNAFTSMIPIMYGGFMPMGGNVTSNTNVTNNTTTRRAAPAPVREEQPAPDNRQLVRSGESGLIEEPLMVNAAPFNHVRRRTEDEIRQALALGEEYRNQNLPAPEPAPETPAVAETEPLSEFDRLMWEVLPTWYKHDLLLSRGIQSLLPSGTATASEQPSPWRKAFNNIWYGRQ